MRSSKVLRNSLLLGFAVSCGMAACGSDDGSKTQRRDRPEAGGEGGGSNPSGAPNSEDGGEPTAPGGGSGGTGGTSGTGGSVAGQAGNESEAGSAGAEGGAGAAGAPSIVCAAGTADCDDDPSDCETNTATDVKNCGRCARACGGTAACTTGLCEATVLLDPTDNSNWCGAAFTATRAYMITCWGNYVLSEVRSAALEPGADVLGTGIKSYSSATSNAVSLVALRGILIDGNDVLFGLSETPSHIYKAPLNAAGPADVSVGYTYENGVRFDDLQLVGDTFYFESNTHTTAGQFAPSTIRKAKKTDLTSTVVITGLGSSYNLIVFDTKLLWAERRTANGMVNIYRGPLAGADAADTELIAAATGGYLVRQGDYAYWTVKLASPNGKLQRIKAGDADAKVEDVATGLTLPEGLTTDQGYAYFKQEDSLYRVALAGGIPERLSPVVPAHDSQATAVYRADDKYVYFAAGPGFGFSTLVRVAK